MNPITQFLFIFLFVAAVSAVFFSIRLIHTKPETVKHHLRTIAAALRQKLQITKPDKIKLLQMAVTSSWVLGSGWFAVERTLNPQSFQASIDLNEHPIASIIGALIPTVVLAPLAYWMFGPTARRIAARSVQRLQITRPDKIKLLQSTSKLHAVLGAAILIVATAAVTTIVLSKWNVFPPADYEDCAARAAKNAKTKEGLWVLLTRCNSDFKGRRMPGGGYAYHNSCEGARYDIGGTYTIKGPNPTPAEQKHMNAQCLADIEAERRAAEQKAEETHKLEQAAGNQAFQERAAAAAAASALQLRKSQTIPAVQVTAKSSKCTLGMNRDTSCAMDLINLQVEVTNRSKETLSSVSIGVASSDGICPSSYDVTQKFLIRLSSGQTNSLMLRVLDASLLRLKNLCIQAVDVKFD